MWVCILFQQKCFFPTALVGSALPLIRDPYAINIAYSRPGRRGNSQNNFFQCFSTNKKGRQRLFSMFFLDVTIGNDYFRLFLTIPIVGANDDRQQSFSQDQLVKRVKRGSKWPTNLNYYFLLKDRLNHRFPMFFSSDFNQR